MNKTWYFQKIDIFKDLGIDEIKSIEKHFQNRYYIKKQQIYSAEEKSDRIYFLHTGRVKLTKYSDDGKEITIDIINPNEVFGEMALVDSSERNSFAIAMDDSLITSINNKDFRRIITHKPMIGLRIMRVIGQRRMEAEQKLEDMVFKDVQSRLADLILKFGRKNSIDIGEKNRIRKLINIRLIHNDIANLIGSTRETTSANLSRFRRDGLIDFEDHKIVILDEQQLEKISHGLN